jgi:hypothetical protein
MDLTNDIGEFKTVLPKSGHRLKVKKVINQAENEGDASSVCSAISSRYTDLTDNDTNLQDEGEEDSVSFHILVCHIV